MGGYGSGRSGGRPTIEACGSYSLNINAFIRGGLRSGILGSSRIKFGDGFEVAITIDCRSEWQPFFELEHYSYREGEEDLVRYRVGLQWTRPHFGGVRWWFVCPRMQDRCGKLFLPRGARYFWSRDAYRLKYQSQRETRCDRAIRRSRKVYRKLGGIGDGWDEGTPDKPKWMRWRTYERLAARREDAELEADSLFVLGAQKLLERLGRTSIIRPAKK